VNLVRQYIRKFSPSYIICDSYGGGSQMGSLLCSAEYSDKTKGDAPLQMLDKDDLTTYSHAENRILRMNVPTNQFNEQSNVQLKSQLEQGLFWFASDITEEVYSKFTSDQISKETFGDLENAFEMIEQTKVQISLIVGKQGSNGLTTFDMPDSLGSIKKKERQRKDLYSATLLAAWGAKEYLTILENGNSTNKPYEPQVGTV